MRRADRFTKMGVLAGWDAVLDSGIEKDPWQRTRPVIGVDHFSMGKRWGSVEYHVAIWFVLVKHMTYKGQLDDSLCNALKVK